MSIRAAVLTLIPMLIVIAGAHGESQAQIFETVGTARAYSWTAFVPDARSEALGKAFVALGEGAAGIWWNPATPPSDRSVETHYLWYEYPLLDDPYSHFAVAGEWRQFRLAYAESRLDVDTNRTIYLPNGEGVDLRRTERMRVFGLSASLSEWLAPWLAGFDSSAGISYRRYSGNDFYPDSDAAAWDLGLNLKRRWSLTGDYWWGIRPAIMMRNLFDDGISTEVFSNPVERSLGQDLRFGLALEGGWLNGRNESRAIEGLISFMASRSVGESAHHRHDTEHFGAELRFWDFLALRGGHDGRNSDSGSAWTWGLGLNLELPSVIPVGLSFDYASVDSNSLGKGRWDRFQLGMHLIGVSFCGGDDG